jgi:hypothetical protein
VLMTSFEWGGVRNTRDCGVETQRHTGSMRSVLLPIPQVTNSVS